MRSFFDETRLNGRLLRNRFLVAPMTRVSADLEGVPTAPMTSYYASFAAGGFGGIITEGVYTDSEYSKAYPNQPGLINEVQVQAWKEIVREVHKKEALIIAQLMHAGSLSQALPRTKAPSNVIPRGQKLAGYGGDPGPFPIPEEMSKKDLKAMSNGFLDTSLNAVKSGFDGVEIHAANGYLLDQFITPYLNTREDEYGGSMENRMRIVAEIISRIRKHTPEKFILGLRISEGKVNHLEYRWPGGSKTARSILKEIAKMPIDFLHVAAENEGWAAEATYSDGTSLTGLAKQVLDCPIMANGQLHDLDLSQHLLDSDQADLISIGKHALSNPDFVNRIRNREDLRPFDSSDIHPNPSLFPEEQFEWYAEEFRKEQLQWKLETKK